MEVDEVNVGAACLSSATPWNLCGLGRWCVNNVINRDQPYPAETQHRCRKCGKAVHNLCCQAVLGSEAELNILCFEHATEFREKQSLTVALDYTRLSEEIEAGYSRYPEKDTPESGDDDVVLVQPSSITTTSDSSGATGGNTKKRKESPGFRLGGTKKQATLSQWKIMPVAKPTQEKVQNHQHIFVKCQVG